MPSGRRCERGNETILANLRSREPGWLILCKKSSLYHLAVCSRTGTGGLRSVVAAPRNRREPGGELLAAPSRGCRRWVVQHAFDLSPESK